MHFVLEVRQKSEYTIDESLPFPPLLPIPLIFGICCDVRWQLWYAGKESGEVGGGGEQKSQQEMLTSGSFLLFFPSAPFPFYTTSFWSVAILTHIGTKNHGNFLFPSQVGGGVKESSLIIAVFSRCNYGAVSIRVSRHLKDREKKYNALKK